MYKRFALVTLLLAPLLVLITQAVVPPQQSPSPTQAENMAEPDIPPPDVTADEPVTKASPPPQEYTPPYSPALDSHMPAVGEPMPGAGQPMLSPGHGLPADNESNGDEDEALLAPPPGEMLR